MAQTDFQSVDEYIGTFSEEVQQDLQAIRQAIREAEPEAEEVISYQLPAYRYHGMVIYFAAFKKHYSISFPPPSAVFDVFKDELAGYKVSKSVIQFPANQPLPLDLISRIVKWRAQENLDRAAEKEKKTIRA